MAASTVKTSTIRNAVRKAQEVAPAVLELAPGFYAVASQSRPGAGYVVRTYTDGHSACECKGKERAGYCYHRAAVGLKLGTVPAAYLEAAPAPVDHSTVVLRTAPKGRAALFA